MTAPIEEIQHKILDAAFRMPSAATMVSRKSSITNAFVGAIIPLITPSAAEIEKALSILGMLADDVRCAYCGDVSTEWDHLRPLVVDRRPTGYITEIANLVPACGKCNQSKGNKPWRRWMMSTAQRSPKTRGIADLEIRMMRLDEFEKWKSPTQIDFERVLGIADWARYWSMCDSINHELKEANRYADELRNRVSLALRSHLNNSDSH